MKKVILVFNFVLFYLIFNTFLLGKEVKKVHTKVCLETNMGKVFLELFDDMAPNTVKNFLNYVQKGFYNETIFHRVIKNFVVQGGGYSSGFLPKTGLDPAIKNEANEKLKNLKGTIAMARTSEIDSAKNQFFINLKDNNFLDHRDNTKDGYGYAVFGKVIKGFEVVEMIGNVKTAIVKGFRDVPLDEVKLLVVHIIED